MSKLLILSESVQWLAPNWLFELIANQFVRSLSTEKAINADHLIKLIVAAVKQHTIDLDLAHCSRGEIERLMDCVETLETNPGMLCLNDESFRALLLEKVRELGTCLRLRLATFGEDREDWGQL